MTKSVKPKDSKTKQTFVVTRESVIGDILEKNPSRTTRLAEIMTSFGLHCIGCSANTFDTIENGCRLHGMPEETIDELISELNKCIHEDVSQRKGIELSEKAAQKIKELQKKDGKNEHFLKITVKEGGCAGMTYDLAFVKVKEPKDLEVELQGVKLAMDAESRKFLEGSIIDFVDSLQGSGFKIDNPNVTRSCRCGESFG